MFNTDLVVIGLGYVGLPLAAEATRAGMKVRGYEVNAGVVEGLNAGRSHVDDLTDEDVAGLVVQGFSATSDPAVLDESETIVICVPTPLGDDGGPDLRAVESA